jgi:hypothetical protein
MQFSKSNFIRYQPRFQVNLTILENNRVQGISNLKTHANLCKVLENPARYNGFTTQVYTIPGSGKDYRGRWDSTTKKQYRINIDSTLSIDERYYHSCDGYVQDEHWDWDNACHITDTRRIIEVLRDIWRDL